MTVKRYAVLDKNGVKINSILIDDPFPAGYSPGYGVSLVCEEGAATNPEKSILPVLSITPNKRLESGDTINDKNGVVTKMPISTKVDDDGQTVVKAFDVNYSAKAKEAGGK